MTTHSAACSLAIEEQLSPGPGSPALAQALPAPTAHYRTNWCRLCGTHGSRIRLSPCALLPNTHLPSPDKANFPLSRSLRTSLREWLSGLFVLRVPSALLFLAFR